MAQVDPQRGEVWYVDLKTDATGTGQDKPERPAVVVSSDAAQGLRVKIVVPITGWDESYQGKFWHVQLLKGGSASLDKTSSADTLGLRSVSINRFRRKLGQLDKEDIAKVEAALKLVLRLR
jgi:mRNA interferase MazF